jgi:hypothetical protein
VLAPVGARCPARVNRLRRQETLTDHRQDQPREQAPGMTDSLAHASSTCPELFSQRFGVHARIRSSEMDGAPIGSTTAHRWRGNEYRTGHTRASGRCRAPVG